MFRVLIIYTFFSSKKVYMINFLQYNIEFFKTIELDCIIFFSWILFYDPLS